ncbi:MAG: transglycosylase domain-containing protein [Pseudomonadota bacterium]
MDEASESPSLKLRLRRETSGFAATLSQSWEKRWFRLASYALGLILLGWLLVWLVFARNLPSVDRLKTYEPPLPTNVRGLDGTPVHSYARERRVQLRYDEFPITLVHAYMAAEDKTFFEHSGLDYPGIVSAMITNIGSSGRKIGASTITQQVAKNLLLTNEVSYVRKVKEAILAKRIESALTKKQIMELYLNQIALGRSSFGVQAAARAYFAKDVGELSIAEMAFLAILPKAPETYGRAKNADRAMKRRAFVLKEMLENEFINEADYQTAMARPLGLIPRSSSNNDLAGGYFLEEVRRDLIAKFGETSEGGRNPFSVYDGGLWIRTSLDPQIQSYAEEALRDGFIRYDGGRGWTGPIKTLDPGTGWAQRLAGANLGAGYPEWRVAILLEKDAGSAQIGFTDGKTGTLPAWGATMPRRGTATSAFNAMKPGDVILVKAEGSAWVLRSVPAISGGMVVQNPHTGRILAMQGGFDSRIQSYNRATQAQRQPGSSFKPFVYAAALDSGMTPASIIIDGAFCVYQSAKLGRKCFKNFGGSSGSGAHTMRWGLEQSRNLMTVRAASQTGMEKVVKLASAAGISGPGRTYSPVLAIALGAGETTVMKMVNAYSILARNGRDVSPTLIDFVQDRNGKIRYRADTRPCERCNMPEYDGKPMPRPAPRTKQAIDALSAYQTVHMLEGVIQRGTATQLIDLKRPIFGKTGTTTGPTNVWFVGGSADMVAGVYLGFDQPKPMGSYAQGGTLAVPIFKSFAAKAMKDMPVVPFRAPAGIRMVRIDRNSGKRVYGAWPSSDPKAAVIWEAFKPESEPRRSIRRDELPKLKANTKATSSGPEKATEQPRDSEFLQREGGIY